MADLVKLKMEHIAAREAYRIKALEVLVQLYLALSPPEREKVLAKIMELLELL